MRDFHIAGRSATYASTAMCATSHPLAAQVALQILQDGGNAVDAAIAGAVLLTICEPHMCGLGGDCFSLIQRPGDAALIGLNGSGRAPAGLSAQRMRDAGHIEVPLRGIEAVTLPGAVDGFCRMSEDWGRLSLAETLAPAIFHAENGVPVAPRVAADWQSITGNLQGDSACEKYLFNGAAPNTGQIFRAPMLAEVMRRIANQGRAGFYEGEVADDMIASLAAMDGSHSSADLASTTCDYVTPICGLYQGAELYELPPNGQGATAILLLNILSHFDIASMDPFGTMRAHIEAEASKLAYDARDRFIADADFSTRLDHMLAPETASSLAALIDPNRGLPAGLPGAGAVHKDTVYITVVDKDRMAVSLIFSLFQGFGSGIASEKFGILFQNRGAGFSLEKGHSNEAAGGKRPMHTIIPGLLRGKGFAMPFGVMGGAYQPCGHARLISNLLDFDLDPQAAIDAPRCFADQGKLVVERGYGPEVHQGLADLGHELQVPDKPLGGAQAIVMRDDGVLIGGSDPRKDGCALGY